MYTNFTNQNNKTSMSATIDTIQTTEEGASIHSRNSKTKTKSWRRFLTRRLIFMGVVAFIVLGALIGGAIIFYKNYTQTDAYKKKQEEKELVKTVNAVGSVLLLPSGRPTMFVIADAQALSTQQAFFRGAINGDRLLIYKDVGKAVLYSPTRHLIVNVGPITTDDSEKTSTVDSVKDASSAKVQEPTPIKKK